MDPRSLNARQKRERDNERAAIGERIAAYREAGMTWAAVTAVEGIGRDEARICLALYRRLAVLPWRE